MSEASLAIGAEPGERADDPVASYRPHLDGLRAVAVYLVLLFHAGIGTFSGGFVGVDVFFVLSGFLVTQLLLRDVARNGSIRFGRFYSRRFRRLLPAAFAALMVTAAVYTAIASPVEVSAAVGAFKAAFLYSTNWYFIHQATGYFGADISTNPVLHFWSLAVEEQFYLLWPLTLGGAFVLTRKMDRARQMRMIRIAVAFGALASVVWALSLRTSDPNRAYYGTDTRAYELLAGAFVALTPELMRAVMRFPRAVRAAMPISVAVVLVVASSVVDYNAIVRGVAVTIATCVFLVTVEVADGGLVKRALSTRSMVYLGKISYGTYLWHWLVILVVLRVFHPSAVATLGIAFLVATGVASLSFEMLEQPVRMSGFLDRHRRVVIASGLAISVLSALVFIPRIVTSSDASTGAVHSTAPPLLTPLPKNLLFKQPKLPFPNCVAQPVSDCTIVKGKGRSILLMGDSHAWMLIPTFTIIARREGWTLSVSGEGACPWQRNVDTPLRFADCQRLKEDEYKRVIPELHPDLIVTMNVGYGTPGDYPQPLEGPDHHALTVAEIEKATTTSIAQLRAGGRDVLLIEPVPLPRTPSHIFNPYTCLESAKVLEQCRYTAWLRPSKLTLLYRQQAKTDPRVFDLSLEKAVCPLFPVCDPVVNGQIVKRDSSHLTNGFALTLPNVIETYMRSEGLMPEGPRASS